MSAMQALFKGKECENLNKPEPFKLCFIEKNVLGQSNIKIGKPLNIGVYFNLQVELHTMCCL